MHIRHNNLIIGLTSYLYTICMLGILSFPRGLIGGGARLGTHQLVPSSVPHLAHLDPPVSHPLISPGVARILTRFCLSLTWTLTKCLALEWLMRCVGWGESTADTPELLSRCAGQGEEAARRRGMWGMRSIWWVWINPARRRVGVFNS